MVMVPPVSLVFLSGAKHFHATMRAYVEVSEASKLSKTQEQPPTFLGCPFRIGSQKPSSNGGPGEIKSVRRDERGQERCMVEFIGFSNSREFKARPALQGTGHITASLNEVTFKSRYCFGNRPKWTLNHDLESS